MEFQAPAHGSVWTVYCDGSAMPNPGAMGIGAILVDPAGLRHTLSEVTTAKGCNNEAELRALLAALVEAKNLGAAALHIHTDSSILVEQLGLSPSRPIARLATLFNEARTLMQGFEHTRLQWIPRHKNADADALARAALGIAPPAPPASAAVKAGNRQTIR